jgi:chitodextrinase
MKSKAGIKKYSWLINDNFVIDALNSLEYTFTDYGKQKVSVKITDFAGNTYELLDEFNLLRPLKLATLKKDNHVVTNSLLKVTDSNGNSLINDTYNKEENVYDITDFDIPQTSVTFNANSVRVTDPKYDLINVDWDFDGDGKFEQKGKVVKHDFLEEKKYTVTAHYTFISNEKSDEQYLDETLIFDGKKKEIIPRLKIIPDSEYAPTTVRFDASASETKAGTITKFTYDFGEGKPPVDGDAQMQYRYILGGDYIVKLTVTKDDGTKETIARRLVLKDGSKNVTINTSASSGIIGSGIDFDAAGSAGQITEYAWDFGDNSTSTEPRPTHIYQSAGTFTVSLKVTYLDGTLKDTTKDIVIKDPTATNEPIPQ